MNIENLNYLNEFKKVENMSIEDKINILSDEYNELIRSHVAYKFGINTNSSEVAQKILDLIFSSINLLEKMEYEELITSETEIFKHSIKLLESTK